MKDFVKIFLVLCGFVACFLFGRNYGEQTFKQSEEYLSFVKAKQDQSFADSDFANAKAKLQNIIDGAENKKSEELLAQILQVFLADLGLRIQNQNNFIKAAATMPGPTIDAHKEKVAAIEAPTEKPAAPEKKEKFYNYKRIKSYEWILENSQDSDQLKDNLKNVEIKDLDTYLKQASKVKPQDMDSLFGSYRGQILDVTKSEFGSMAIEMKPVEENGKPKLNGSIRIFRNGKETSGWTFTSDELGFKAPESAGFLLDNQNTFYQLYKIPNSQQIAGYYYERLVNGTTKQIGSFVLNRVDQF